MRTCRRHIEACRTAVACGRPLSALRKNRPSGPSVSRCGTSFKSMVEESRARFAFKSRRREIGGWPSGPSTTIVTARTPAWSAHDSTHPSRCAPADSHHCACLSPASSHLCDRRLISYLRARQAQRSAEALSEVRPASSAIAHTARRKNTRAQRVFSDTLRECAARTDVSMLSFH